MPHPEQLPPWESDGFADALREWVEQVAGPVASMRQGKLRPWATVWQVRVGERLYYAKLNCPGQLFEAGLVAELAGLAPSYVVPVTAADPARGLLLTPDQGAVFAETVAGDDLDAWCRLVSRAMELARLVAPARPALAAAGLTGCDVPAEVAPVVTPWLEELAALGLPDTLVHNDLHEHNAFDQPGGLIFFDFADAVLGHPLSGLLVPFDVLSAHLDCGPGDARLQRVADAALEVWSDLVPMAELRRALPAALRLGRLGRAQSWGRVLPDLSGDALAEYGHTVDAWLARLPDPVPVSFDGSP